MYLLLKWEADIGIDLKCAANIAQKEVLVDQKGEGRGKVQEACGVHTWEQEGDTEHGSLANPAFPANPTNVALSLILLSSDEHTLEKLWVWFQISTIKRVLQQSKLQSFC